MGRCSKRLQWMWAMTLDAKIQELVGRPIGLAAYEASVNEFGDVSVKWSDQCFSPDGCSAGEPGPEKALQEFFGPSYARWRENLRKVLRKGSPYDWEHAVLCNGARPLVRHRLMRLGKDKAIGVMELRAPPDSSRDARFSPKGGCGERRSIQAAGVSEKHLAAFSHEIKNPMNVILGLARQALKTELTPEQREYIGNISATAQHLMGILRNMLHFFKMDTGMFELESLPVRITEIFAVQKAMFSVKAREKGLELEFFIGADVPPQVHGDMLRISEVLGNLLSNSLKFTHTGGIYVRCELEEQDEESALLRFTVRDTGIGMTREQQMRVFEPFYQANPSVSRIYGGTGLGLYIVKKLVEKMGGGVGVKSARGNGTNISFTCRLALSGEEERLPSEAGPPRFSGEKILVVEDDPLNQAIIKGLLEELNLTVVTANSGRSALEILKEQEDEARCSLVFMDLQMPELDGFRACLFMRNIPELEKTPVIALSASSGETNKLKCLGAGMNDCLSKPIDVKELYRVLRRYLIEAV